MSKICSLHENSLLFQLPIIKGAYHIISAIAHFFVLMSGKPPKNRIQTKP